ncbi:hypothetical protein BJ684DRAFT_15915 [Piptocephalis cylindrospora]|uniref:MINDY deubiquitinase domain-containing protein n=1 Tax=Piptocephalis cylindrospora TaxID=1907219 RepID=A0A4P9Y773_9FUNG|nr:hypothetical protein BJ684DRAFT_15915 [Piptocephalis cylindrospora]|eukprot:RKP13710.1 hypothetical protein BJ684DRAFT_15915 [Piptocephalis cylindrospora]
MNQAQLITSPKKYRRRPDAPKHSSKQDFGLITFGQQSSKSTLEQEAAGDSHLLKSKTSSTLSIPASPKSLHTDHSEGQLNHGFQETYRVKQMAWPTNPTDRLRNPIVCIVIDCKDQRLPLISLVNALALRGDITIPHVPSLNSMELMSLLISHMDHLQASRSVENLRPSMKGASVEELPLLSKPIVLDPYLTNPRAFTPQPGLKPFELLEIPLRHACCVSIFDEDTLKVLQGKSYTECERLARGEELEGFVDSESSFPPHNHYKVAQIFFRSVTQNHCISPAGIEVLSAAIPLGNIGVLFHSGNEYSVMYRRVQDESLYLLLSSSMSPLHTWVKVEDYGRVGDDAVRYDEDFMDREMRKDRVSHSVINMRKSSTTTVATAKTTPESPVCGQYADIPKTAQLVPANSSDSTTPFSRMEEINHENSLMTKVKRLRKLLCLG